MKYTLAGAYDSNIALILSVGDSRETLTEDGRNTASHDLAWPRPEYQPQLPLRLGTLVFEPYGTCATNNEIHCPVLTAVGELAAGLRKLTLRRRGRLIQGLREECRCCLGGEENVNPAATQQLLDCPHTLSAG